MNGLVAAITAAQEIAYTNAKIILVEASPSLGGRAQTDVKDGYVLDRDFAVFIEDYPLVQQLGEQGILNDLKLGRFLPGSYLKLNGATLLARVVDPFRKLAEIFGPFSLKWAPFETSSP